MFFFQSIRFSCTDVQVKTINDNILKIQKSQNDLLNYVNNFSQVTPILILVLSVLAVVFFAFFLFLIFSVIKNEYNQAQLSYIVLFICTGAGALFFIVTLVFIILQGQPSQSQYTNINDDIQNIKTITDQFSKIIASEQYLQNNLKTVQAVALRYNNCLWSIINANTSLFSKFNAFNPSIVSDVPSSNNITNENISYLNANYPEIFVTTTEILKFIESINGIGNYSCTKFLSTMQNYITAQTKLITTGQKLDNTVLNLDDVLQLEIYLNNNIKQLGYTATNNLQDLLLYISGKSAILVSTENQIYLDIIDDYNQNICSNVDINGLLDIANAIFEFIGPNYSAAGFIDQTQTFANNNGLNQYVIQKASAYRVFDQNIQNIKSDLLGLINIDDDLNTFQNNVNTFLNETYRCFTQDYSINTSQTVMNLAITDVTNQILNLYLNTNAITNLWGMTMDQACSIINQMNNLNSMMNSNFGTNSCLSGINASLNIINQIIGLFSFQNVYGLSFSSVDLGNFDIFFNSVVNVYKNILSNYSIIDSSVVSVSDFTVKFSNLMNNIINMPNPDGMLLTTSKNSIDLYLKAIKDRNANLYAQFLTELNTLFLQCLDFSGSSSWYSSSEIQKKSNYSSSSINLNSFSIPLKLITTTSTSDVTNLKLALNGDPNVNLLVRNYPNGKYQIIPSVTISYLLDNFALKMQNIYSVILTLSDQLGNNLIITNYLLNNYVKVLSSFLSACTTIPTLRFSCYFLLFSKVSGNSVGIAFQDLCSMSQIADMLNNIPIELTQANTTTLNI